jgi:hypothetical protein
MFEEKFFRKTIRNFPYKQCPLLQQLVQLIAPITLIDDTCSKVDRDNRNKYLILKKI